MRNSYRLINAIATSALILMATSCIDEDYDLSQDIDTTVTLDGKFSMPLGDSNLLGVDDFLGFDLEGNDAVKVDEEGNMSIELQGMDTKSSVKVPQISLDPSQFKCETLKMDLDASHYYFGPDYEFDFMTPSTSAALNFSYDLPSEITNVKSIDLDSRFNLDLRLTDGKMKVNTPLRVILPEFITLKKISGNITVDGNIITFFPDSETNADYLTSTPASAVVSVASINLENTPSWEGYVDGKLVIDDKVIVEPASVTSKGAWLPRKFLEISLAMTMKSMDVKSIVADWNISTSIESSSKTIEGLPEFFEENGAALDLYDIQMPIKAENNLPFDAHFSATIESYRDNAKIGAASISDDIHRGTDAICFSSRNDIQMDGYTMNYIPELSTLGTYMPDNVKISGMDITGKAEGVEIHTGESYGIECEGKIVLPLAFGNKCNISATTDLNNISLFSGDSSNLEAEGTVTIKTDLVNTLPLDLKIAASPINAEGNVLENLTVTVDGRAVGGTLSSPSTSQMTITIKASKESLKAMKGIRLEVTANAETKPGVQLNKNQGVQFKNMKMAIEGTVTTK